MHFPHPINKKIKSVTRLVILPDYQGIGLGTKFLNIISEMYIKKGFDFKIQTSAKNLISSLLKDKSWILSRYGKATPQTNVEFKKTSSVNRITATFFKKVNINN
jgi:GNAT superfamily N-acetyltransferase